MKQVSIYGIFLLLLSAIGYGQKETTPKKTVTGKRLEALIPPAPLGWVSDFEHVFTRKQINYLDSIIEKNEKRTSTELAVITLKLDSVSIRSLSDFEELSFALVKKWGIGKKGKNNGIAILFSVKLRMVRIEVVYGSEAMLTDNEAKDIIDKIIRPAFKKRNYFTGINNALKRIIKETE